MIISGSVVISTDPQAISFPTGVQMPTATYIISWSYYDADYQTLGGNPVAGSKTVNGFSFSGPYAGTLEYTVTEVGTVIGYVATSTRLSRNWTAQHFYAEAVRDLGLRASRVLYGERFYLINRAIQKAVSIHSSILGNAYLTGESTDDTGDTLSLAALKMQMGGPEQKIVVVDSVSGLVDFVEYGEYATFRPSAFQNKSRIVWTKVGDSAIFTKGYGVTAYGTRTFYFPRLANECTADAHLIDFPDSFMHLAITEHKRILAERYREIVGPVRFAEETGEMATKKASETAELESDGTLKKAL